MLTLYRRHRKNCAHWHAGRDYRRCRCPIWVDGMLRGEEIRLSLGSEITTWEQAEEEVGKWKNKGSEPAVIESGPVTTEHAWGKFLADLRAQKRSEPTVYKYTLLSRRMMNFAQDKGLRFLTEFSLDILTEFRSGWSDGPRSSRNKLELMRAFFRFAEQREWVGRGPTRLRS